MKKPIAFNYYEKSTNDAASESKSKSTNIIPHHNPNIPIPHHYTIPNDYTITPSYSNILPSYYPNTTSSHPNIPTPHPTITPLGQPNIPTPQPNITPNDYNTMCFLYNRTKGLLHMLYKIVMSQPVTYIVVYSESLMNDIIKLPKINKDCLKMN